MEKRINCLLIDDDADEHEIFRMAVADTHLPVTCSSFLSWAEAKRSLENKAFNAPDFIFMDWYLSGIEGADYIIALKQMARLQSSQIIIYSGFRQSEIITSMLSVYNCKYLAKTESITNLTEQLRLLWAS